MARVQSCPHCEAQLDTEGQKVGSAITCGGCGNVLQVAAGRPAAPVRGGVPDARAHRPREPRESLAPEDEAEAKQLARERLRAVRTCDAALYTCFGMLVATLLVGLLGLAVMGGIAVVLALLGLSRIRRAGPWPVFSRARPGVERSAVRQLPRAPAKARLALGLGAAGIVASVVLFAAVLQQSNREHAQRDRYIRELQEHYRPPARSLPLAPPEVDGVEGD